MRVIRNSVWILVVLLACVVSSPASAGPSLRIEDGGLDDFPLVKLSVWLGWKTQLGGEPGRPRFTSIMPDNDHEHVVGTPVVGSGRNCRFSVRIHLAGPRLAESAKPAICDHVDLVAGEFRDTGEEEWNLLTKMSTEHRKGASPRSRGDIDQVGGLIKRHVAKQDASWIHAVVVDVSAMPEDRVREALVDWFAYCQQREARPPRELPIRLVIACGKIDPDIAGRGLRVPDRPGEVVPLFSERWEGRAHIQEQVAMRLFRIDVTYKAYDAQSLGKWLEIEKGKLEGSLHITHGQSLAKEPMRIGFTLDPEAYIRGGLARPDRLGTALRAFFARGLKDPKKLRRQAGQLRSAFASYDAGRSGNQRARAAWDDALGPVLESLHSARFEEMKELSTLLFDRREKEREFAERAKTQAVRALLDWERTGPAVKTLAQLSAGLSRCSAHLDDVDVRGVALRLVGRHLDQDTLTPREVDGAERQVAKILKPNMAGGDWDAVIEVFQAKRAKLSRQLTESASSATELGEDARREALRKLAEFTGWADILLWPMDARRNIEVILAILAAPVDAGSDREEVVSGRVRIALDGLGGGAGKALPPSLDRILREVWQSGPPGGNASLGRWREVGAALVVTDSRVSKAFGVVRGLGELRHAQESQADPTAVAASCTLLRTAVVDVLSDPASDQLDVALCAEAWWQTLQTLHVESVVALLRELAAGDRKPGIQTATEWADNTLKTLIARESKRFRDGEGEATAEAVQEILESARTILSPATGFALHRGAAELWRSREAVHGLSRRIESETKVDGLLRLLDELGRELRPREGVGAELLNERDRARIVVGYLRLSTGDTERFAKALVKLAPTLQDLYVRWAAEDDVGVLALGKILRYVDGGAGGLSDRDRSAFEGMVLDRLVARASPPRFAVVLSGLGDRYEDGRLLGRIAVELEASLLRAARGESRDPGRILAVLEAFRADRGIHREDVTRLGAALARHELEVCARAEYQGAERWRRVKDLLPKLLEHEDVRAALDGSMATLLSGFGDERHRTLENLLDILTTAATPERTWLGGHVHASLGRSPAGGSDTERPAPPAEEESRIYLLALGLGLGLIILILLIVVLAVVARKRKQEARPVAAPPPPPEPSRDAPPVPTPSPPVPTAPRKRSSLDEITDILTRCGCTDLEFVAVATERETLFLRGRVAGHRRLLKVMDPRQRENRALRKRLREEGYNLEEIWAEWAGYPDRDENLCPVVRCHHVGFAEGLVYLVLDDVPGQTLDAMISSTKGLRLSSLAALVLARRLAIALSVIHELRLAHGALTSSNVLVPAGKTVAWRVERARLQNLAIPKGGGEPDRAADIRALGMLLMEALSGRVLPVGSEIDDETLASWLSDQPEAVVGLIERLLATEVSSDDGQDPRRIVKDIDAILRGAGR